MDLPEITLDSIELFNLQNGRIRSRLLVTAVEFNLFTLTTEEKPVKNGVCPRFLLNIEDEPGFDHPP